jgi:hypothetical protein
MTKPANNTLSRRKFIAASAISAGGLALLSIAPSVANGLLYTQKQYTVQQVIDLIMKEGNLSPIPGTVDTLKSGSADQQL